MSGIEYNTSKEIDEKDVAVSPPEYTPNKREDVAVHTHRVHLRDVDDAAALVAGVHDEITEEQSRRIRRKIDRHMLPLMCVDFLSAS